MDEGANTNSTHASGYNRGCTIAPTRQCREKKITFDPTSQSYDVLKFNKVLINMLFFQAQKKTSTST